MGGPCFERLRSGEERKLVELDNFYPAPFILDGECWPTAEHYFQAAKFPSAPALQAQIRMARQCTGAEGCYILGNSRSGQLREDWDEVKLSFMYRANKAKFSANPNLARLLCGTTGQIRALGNEHEWATWNAILLERFREELRGEAEVNAQVLATRISIMECVADVAKLRSKAGGAGLFEARLARAVTMQAGHEQGSTMYKRYICNWCDDLSPQRPTKRARVETDHKNDRMLGLRTI